jgi:eukaryotic-like serine/threonine-protein kinase
MGVFAALVGGLLSQLHQIVGFPVCPGDWVWTVTVAGAVLAIPPVLAAALVAVVRRRIGNRYGTLTVLLFALLGVVGMAVLPLLGFTGAATALQRAALGTGSSGLTSQDAAALDDAYCFLPAQSTYLGGGRSVSAALTALPGPDLLLAGRALVLLVAFPLLALLLTWLLARLAVRRGPAWPARLLWLPFLGLLAGTLPLSEGVVGQLWLGYVVGAVPGLLLLLLIGRPRWSVVNRPAAAARPSMAPPRPQRRRPQPPPQPPRPQPQPPRPQRPQPLPPMPSVRPQPPKNPQPTRQLPSADSVPAGTTAQDPAPGGTMPPRPATDPGQLPPTRVGALAGAGGTAENAGDGHPGSGRFRRLHRLGEGGFGDVWLAMDTELDREVAIKVARAPDPDTELRIRREARALAAVRHPHCVRVYDILSDVDDLPGLAIVMEYVRGPSLARQVQDRGSLSDTEGAHLWSTLAGALAAAHDRGVLHRDVKPANVIIDDTGQAHLIDFGIARTAWDPPLTAAGVVIGTPDYLAPEVAAGGSAHPKSDLWQLAATVSYALCGVPPRGYRESSMEALRAAATREPATELPISSVHLGLLQRALHPEPERRPTLTEVQSNLAGWLARTGRPARGPVTRTLAVPPRP